MPVPPVVAELVERFTANRDDYHAPAYKEDHLRQEFLNPLFEELGWDMANKAGYAEAYKDVVHEDAVKVGGQTKAPDYSFRVGGTRKFFLEAKKPAVPIRTSAEAAYQLRRYAWSAGLPVSVLTNFEHLAVYECRKKPAPTDKAAAGRVLLYAYTDFVEKWDEVAAVFSKTAVLKGSFDKYAEGTRGKRGTATVDGAFLEEIEGWRLQLARNLAARNPALSQRELNYAVQLTIDRIIFLRMCEDRGNEPYGFLRDAAKGTGVYASLLGLFRAADAKYNSGLFHFEAEPGRDHHDTLTPGLAIDDKVLKGIVGNLYYPESPYAFSVLPADILGQVYEQFLGKVIRLTDAHQAKVEDKPEVKKAGGVYYTPGYVVKYIVEKTIGRLLGGASPAKAAKLRVLDPACGSGSFLLGAYEYLLDWHRNWYVADGPEKHRKELVERPGGWRLTLAEKRRILVNNIYGVDIDPQAVEVTKLSLLLKVLEGEAAMALLAKERALPDLDRNILCGNSLVGPDFYDGAGPVDPETRLRVNAFDWKAAFPTVMKAGGFDAVIGNPPYVLVQTLDAPDMFQYFAQKYRAAKYKIDTYQIFIEVGLSLCRRDGLLGFITPNTLLRNRHARELRSLILEGSAVSVLRLFYYSVFTRASVDTCILILQATPRPDNYPHTELVRSLSEEASEAQTCEVQKHWRAHPELHISLPGEAGASDVVENVRTNSIRLGDFATAYFGIQTHDRTKYVSEERLTAAYRPAIDGVNITRYHLAPPTEYVDFRPDAIKSGGKPHVHAIDRLGVRQIGMSPVATWIPGGICSLNTIYNIYPVTDTRYSLHFVLGIVCSKLLAWYWRLEFFDQKETFPKIKKDALLSIPIPRLDFEDAGHATNHNRLVGLVKQMLSLHEELARVRVPHERTALEAQIAATDRQIDCLVYDLYGLTDDDIRVVEGTPA